MKNILKHFAVGFCAYNRGLPPNKYNPSFVVKISKSSTESVFTGIGTPNYALPGTVVINFNGQDLAKPGEVYTINLFGTASTDPNLPFKSAIANTVQVDNSKYHTFWCGSIG